MVLPFWARTRLCSRVSLDHFFAEGRWLVMALDRLARQLRPDLPDLPAAYTDAVAQQLRALHQGNRLFSILPFELASRNSNQEVTRHEVECC